MAISNIRAIGYIKALRSRGCTATLKTGEKTATIAYIIEPDDRGEMMVRQENPRIVFARYGRTGTEKSAGRPVGAAHIEAVFEQGVTDLFEKLGKNRDSTFRQEIQRHRQRLGLPGEADHRIVRNIVPLDDCKESGGGKWSCRVQAEYRDDLLFALGGHEWSLLEGNFDFVHDGGAWRMGSDFGDQFLKAMVRTRVAEAKSKE
uniref:hypothetical protein n=1 Tax=Castellaniella defragrans TaxID=75697 RepID=UPI00333EA959